MKFFIKILLVGLGILLINPTAQAIELGEAPPKVVLKEKLGGRLDGKPWSSEELQGKVHVLFYVDPDEKDTNNQVSEAWIRRNFLTISAIILESSTWQPPGCPISLLVWPLKKSRTGIPKPLICGITRKSWCIPGKLPMTAAMSLPLIKKGRLIFKKEGKLNGRRSKG